MMSAIRCESQIEAVPDSLKLLHLRRHPKGIYGHPDFGNKARKVVVFIDGCFWHGCPKCYREPQSNRDYWLPKITRNRQRDLEVTERLKNDGWTVIRIWEHDLAE